MYKMPLMARLFSELYQKSFSLYPDLILYRALFCNLSPQCGVVNGFFYIDFQQSIFVRCTDIPALFIYFLYKARTPKAGI